MIFEADVKKDANKKALLLARTRYLEQVEPFIKGSEIRLAYVEPEIQRIVKECSEYLNADEDFVNTHLRQIIADEAVTKPKKQDLSFGNKDKENKERGFGGGPPSPPLKFDPAKVDPEPDEVTDLSYNTGPLLEDELREPDVEHDLNKETFDGVNKNNFSSVQKETVDFNAEEEQLNEPSFEENEEGSSGGDISSALDDIEYSLDSGDVETAKASIDEIRHLLGIHEHNPNQDYYGDPAYASTKLACARCQCDIDEGVVCEKCSSEILKKKLNKSSDFHKHSPYGIPKSHGGDSEANDDKMHSCVEQVMAKGHDKESAIKICKSRLFPKDATTKESNPINYNAPGQTNINELCPQCSTPLMPGQQNCASCGWSGNNIQQFNSPDTNRNMENARPDAVLNQRGQWGQYPSFQGNVTGSKDIRSMETNWKTSQLPGELDQNAPPITPQPMAPQQPMVPKEEPVRVDQGLGGGPRQRFDDVISNLANKAAAVEFSKPSDDEIQKIAQQYGLDENTVRQNLKVVARFGDVVAVNGEVNGNDDTENYEEIQQLGGQVNAHKAQVPLNLAISKVAEDLGVTNDDVYANLKDSFGNQDLPNQYETDIQGDHRFYLPMQLLGNNEFMNSQEPMQQPPPDDTRQDLQRNPAH